MFGCKANGFYPFVNLDGDKTGNWDECFASRKFDQYWRTSLMRIYLCMASKPKWIHQTMIAWYHHEFFPSKCSASLHVHLQMNPFRRSQHENIKMPEYDWSGVSFLEPHIHLHAHSDDHVVTRDHPPTRSTSWPSRISSFLCIRIQSKQCKNNKHIHKKNEGKLLRYAKFQERWKTDWCNQKSVIYKYVHKCLASVIYCCRFTGDFDVSQGFA